MSQLAGGSTWTSQQAVESRNKRTKEQISDYDIARPDDMGPLSLYENEKSVITLANPVQPGLSVSPVVIVMDSMIMAALRKSEHFLKMLVKMRPTVLEDVAALVHKYVIYGQTIGRKAAPGTESTYLPGEIKSLECAFNPFMVNFQMSTRIMVEAYMTKGTLPDSITKAIDSMHLQFFQAMIRAIFNAYHDPDFSNVMHLPGFLQSMQAANDIATLVEKSQPELGRKTTDVTIIAPSTILRCGHLFDFKEPVKVSGFSGLVSSRAGIQGLDCKMRLYDPSVVEITHLCTTQGAVITPPKSFRNAQVTLNYGNGRSKLFLMTEFLPLESTLDQKTARAWVDAYKATQIPEDAPTNVQAAYDAITKDATPGTTPKVIRQNLKLLLSAGFFPGKVVLLSELRTNAFPIIIIGNGDSLQLALKRIRYGMQRNDLTEEETQQMATDYAILPGMIHANCTTIKDAMIGVEVARSGSKAMTIRAKCISLGGKAETPGDREGEDKPTDETCDEQAMFQKAVEGELQEIMGAGYEYGDCIALGFLNGNDPIHQYVNTGLVFTPTSDLKSLDKSNLYEVLADMFSDQVKQQIDIHTEVEGDKIRLSYCRLHQTLPHRAEGNNIVPPEFSIGDQCRNLSTLYERFPVPLTA